MCVCGGGGVRVGEMICVWGGCVCVCVRARACVCSLDFLHIVYEVRTLELRMV